LIQSVRHVTVKTKPEHLVDELFVDVTELELGQVVRIRDIEVNDDIQIMNPPATPVCGVEVPRALRSAQSEDEEGEEGAVEGAPAEAAAE